MKRGENTVNKNGREGASIYYLLRKTDVEARLRRSFTSSRDTTSFSPSLYSAKKKLRDRIARVDRKGTRDTSNHESGFQPWDFVKEVCEREPGYVVKYRKICKQRKTSSSFFQRGVYIRRA